MKKITMLLITVFVLSAAALYAQRYESTTIPPRESTATTSRTTTTITRSKVESEETISAIDADNDAIKGNAALNTVEYYINRGYDFMQKGDFIHAREEANIALKSDRNNKRARDLDNELKEWGY